MALKIERRTLDDASHKLDVAGNLSKAGKKIELPMDRWVKKIGLILTGQYDTSGATTANEDNPMSLLGNVAIAVNGKRIRDVPFATLHYKNIYDYRGVVPTRAKAASGTVSNKKFSAVAVFDFCSEPGFPNSHPLSLDALIPAHELSSFDVIVDTKAASDLGTNLTLDSAELYPWIEEVSMSSKDEEALYGRNRENLRLLLESVATKKIDASYSNYQFEADLPTGNILRRSLLKAVDNGVRNDSIITSFRTFVKSLGIEDQWNWRAAQEDDRIGLGIGKLANMDEIEPTTDDAIVPTITGLVMNDYADLGFLDLRGVRAGVAKLQMNTGSPTGTSQIEMLHEEYASAALLSRLIG